MPEEDKKLEEQNDEESKDTEAKEKESEEQKEEIKPFQNLDGKEVYIFGWEPDAENKCWYNLSLRQKALGWNESLIKDIELSLAKNVDACYFYIASLYFIDLDDDVHYHAFFDNMKGLWKLEITDSPKAELEVEQIRDFFNSDLMKKAAKQCYTIITNAAKEFEQNLRQMLESANFIEVDEVKLAAELELINQDVMMENLRTCKWMPS